jgi:hypothetical protein
MASGLRRMEENPFAVPRPPFLLSQPSLKYGGEKSVVRREGDIHALSLLRFR